MRALVYVGAGALTIAVVVLLLLAPVMQIVIAGVLGIIAAGVLVAYPRMLAVFALLAVVFAQSVEHLGGEGPAGMVDDALVVLAIVGIPVSVLLRGERLRGFPRAMTWFAAIYVLLGTVSDLVNSVPLGTALVGTYLAVRPFLLGWAILQIRWSPRDGRRLGMTGVTVLWIIVGCGVVNLIIPNQWTAIFATNPIPEYNGFVPGIVGPFAHPSFFGQILALGVIFLVAYRLHLGRGHTALIASAGVFALLSFRRKTLVSLPAGILQTVLAKRAVGTRILLVLLTPVAVVVAWPQLSNLWSGIFRTYFVAPDENARSALTINALDVANTHAPLGAGFGRYGSSVAATDYSPEYIERGFHKIYGLEPIDPRFASDTFWPQVLGESGWIGAAAVVCLLLSVFVYLVRLTRTGSNFEQMLGAAGAGWLIMLAVESIAAPVFSAPPTYALLPALLAFTVAVRNGRPESGDGTNDHRQTNLIHKHVIT